MNLGTLEGPKECIGKEGVELNKGVVGPGPIVKLHSSLRELSFC